MTLSTILSPASLQVLQSAKLAAEYAAALQQRGRPLLPSGPTRRSSSGLSQDTLNSRGRGTEAR